MDFVRRIGIYTALLAVLAGTVLPAARVHAQAAPTVRPPLSLTTSPLPLNVVTKPGTSVTTDIRIKNNGTQQESLKVELLKFGATDATGRPQIMERDPRDQYFNWVSFSEATFTADPNVWKTVHMTINPPKEAAFGYYYAVVFTRSNPDKPTGGNSAFEGGVASLVLLTVDAPGARRDAQIRQLVATQKVYEFLPASFTAKLHNGGNVHVAPAGTMFIKRGGAQVAAIDFNQEQGNILPGTDREFTVNWDDGFPSYKDVKDANGKTTRKLVWDFSKLQKLRFGRYTANLVAVYDDGKRDVPVEAVVSFWVIPWRILGFILLIILFVIFGLWGMGRLLWRGIRRNVITPAQVAGAAGTQATPTAPAPPALPQLPPEPEPDESSLAAAIKKKRGRKPKQPVAETPAPPAESSDFALLDDVFNDAAQPTEPSQTEQSAAEMPAQPAPKRRGRPPKSASVVPGATAVPTTKPTAPRASGTSAKSAPRRLATKPSARLATKPSANKPARGRPPKNKGA